jgi:hypothetical protein
MPTEHKQEKYCQTIRNRNLNAKHTLNETKLHGKPLHATRITPKERAHITDLKHLTATQRDKPHVLLNSPKGTDFELNRWLHALSSPPSPHPVPTPTQVLHVQTFSDASSGTGIALLIGEEMKGTETPPRLVIRWMQHRMGRVNRPRTHSSRRT